MKTPEQIKEAVAEFKRARGRLPDEYELEMLSGDAPHALLGTEQAGVEGRVAEMGADPGIQGGYGPTPAGGTLETGDAGSTAGGAPGAWETAIMSVAKVAPSIIQAATQRKSYAPTPNIGGRRTMDIPKAGDVYSDKKKGFQSLLAMFLRGR